MTDANKECFGQQWEEHDPVCAGGLDPMYAGPNGTKIRPKCGYYDACGRITRANAAQQQAQKTAYVPVENLTKQIPQYATRPQYVQPQPPQPPRPVVYQPPPPPAPVQVQSQTPPVQTYQNYPQYRQQAPQPPPPQAPLPPPNMYPAVYHQTATLSHYEAPAYLTVAEDADVPMWQRILSEAARAGIKGIMQQGAFFVDHTRMIHKK